MKNFGLRKKLFIQIGGLSIFLVLLLFIANTFLLSPYYLYQTKEQLKERYDEILALDLDFENLDYLPLIEIENRSNVEIIIADDHRRLLYSSIGYMNNEEVYPKLQPEASSDFTAPPHRQVPELQILEKETINDTSRFITAIDPIGFSRILMLEGSYDDEYTIEIRVTLVSITRTTEIINTFILFTGVILFLVALIMSSIISKHFTTPIKNITVATDKIKELDFDTSVHVNSNDELGTLSNNINQMNTTLKSAFNDLSVANLDLQSEINERSKLDNKRKELLNSVSHELKTPLSILQGYAEALNSGVITNDEKREFYCNVIIDEAHKTNQLLSQLLDINQLEFGDITLHKSKVDFDEFMTYIVEKLSTHNNIRIPIDRRSDKGATILADPLRLEQVITNYIQNAIKYVDERNLLNIRWTIDAEHLRVIVFNSHENFDPKTMEQLFDSFYKGDSSRDRSKGGYGLGLSIVKAIQETDSNTFGASNVNDGVEFYAEFDLYKEES